MLKVLAGLIVIAGAGANAAAQDYVYALNPGSYYEYGCHGGCDCPIQIHAPLTGTFRLSFANLGPLFDNYTVSDVHWVSAERGMTGGGTYRIGGEVAYQNEMVLDLSIAGTAKHLDSGLVVVQGAFPNSIIINVDNRAASPLCYDTVIHLDASPVARYCIADFDGNGDSGTDADIEAFFACIAGSCCSTCASADFNGDGDVGTDADIESFFRVLGGGAC